MSSKTENLVSTLTLQPVVPVIVIDDARHAVPLARALVAGGLKAIEITLRTAAALDAIKAVAEEVEGAVAGAGTVLDAKQWDLAVKAGSKFIVSPGSCNSVLDAADASDIPLLPGAVTATEVMMLRDRGYSVLKFFPAEQAGGASYINALSSPLAGIRFCPTWTILSSRTSSASAVPGLPPRRWSRPATGRASQNWRPKRRPCAAEPHRRSMPDA
jgi:2-dehydro-3-deoxyphosphogluconate aldolase/(4S)-4-hydroxy-2-oxoglutarate aldolase